MADIIHAGAPVTDASAAVTNAAGPNTGVPAATPATGAPATAGPNAAPPATETKTTGNPHASTPPETRCAVAAAAPSHLYVAIDSVGYMGTFRSPQKAWECTDKHGIKVVLVAYPYDAKSPGTHVYIIPPAQGAFPLYATNNYEQAKGYHAQLNEIGQTIDDDINYWKQPIDQLCPPAKLRLERIAAGLAFDQKREDLLFETANLKPAT